MSASTSLDIAVNKKKGGIMNYFLALKLDQKYLPVPTTEKGRGPERNSLNKIEKVFPILIQDGDAKIGTKINIHV